MSDTARLVRRGGHMVWTCPTSECHKTLAEVFGDRIVIRTGDRFIEARVSSGLQQTCPTCGAKSAIAGEEKVA